MTELTYRTAIVRQPGENFSDGLTEAGLGRPDYEKALHQHNSYVATLKACGLDVTCLPADLRYPDGCFVEDCAIVLPKVAIITNPGHLSRKGETENIANVLSRGLSIARVNDPGTVDGGDVLRVENHYVIGISKRTNEEGAHQLGAILQEHGKTYSTVPVRGLHLKTSVAYVGNSCIVCTEDYNADSQFQKATQKLSKCKVVVPENERYAANCLRVNGTLIVATGFETTKRALEANDFHIVTLDMSEFQKMDGGLTCLSLLLS